MNTNRGILAKTQFEMTLIVDIPLVKRTFVGIDELKKGFLNGCLPFIGFYVCHLKDHMGEFYFLQLGRMDTVDFILLHMLLLRVKIKKTACAFFKWSSILIDKFSRDKPWTFVTNR